MKNIEVQGHTYKILEKFPVMHVGWECDSEGYLVEDENKIVKIVMTNHGFFYFPTAIEMQELINGYKKITDKTETILGKYLGLNEEQP